LRQNPPLPRDESGLVRRSSLFDATLSLSLDLAALCAARLGICGASAVVGFLDQAMRFSHGSFSLKSICCFSLFDERRIVVSSGRQRKRFQAFHRSKLFNPEATARRGGKSTSTVGPPLRAAVLGSGLINPETGRNQK
jgi:hypothetical protein